MFGADRVVRPYKRLPKAHALSVRAGQSPAPTHAYRKPIRRPFSNTKPSPQA